MSFEQRVPDDQDATFRLTVIGRDGQESVLDYVVKRGCTVRFDALRGPRVFERVMDDGVKVKDY